MGVWTLKLGHRINRDQRITSHCGLVARAFGCSGMIYTGQKDSAMEKSVHGVAKEWGGEFEVRHEKDGKRFLQDWKKKGGKSAHLTVYGIPFEERLGDLKKSEGKLLIVVGGEKVAPEVYRLADWNIAVTSQPHSEVAALGILLYQLRGGREIKPEDAKRKVVPQERGKKVVSGKG